MTEFNADAFMNTEVEGESATKYTPIPEGEYPSFVNEVRADTTQKGDALLEVIWVVDDQEVRDLMGQDEPQCRQTVWLDVSEQGTLLFGKNKNVQLGRLRDALGQNTGEPWKPTDMMGRPATILIKHDISNETGDAFARVKGVRA